MPTVSATNYPTSFQLTGGRTGKREKEHALIAAPRLKTHEPASCWTSPGPRDVLLTPASPTGLKVPDRSTGPLIRRDHVGGHSMPRRSNHYRSQIATVSMKSVEVKRIPAIREM